MTNLCQRCQRPARAQLHQQQVFYLLSAVAGGLAHSLRSEQFDDVLAVNGKLGHGSNLVLDGRCLIFVLHYHTLQRIVGASTIAGKKNQAKAPFSEPLAGLDRDAPDD